MNKRECRTACTRQPRAVPDRHARYQIEKVGTPLSVEFSCLRYEKSLIHVPGRFDQELGWWKPTKAKDAQQCITLYTTIHHSILCYYFRHTTDFIGRNARGRSSHASLDINTTSNYCPVSLARVAQSVERRTPVWEAPGSNSTNTQL